MTTPKTPKEPETAAEPEPPVPPAVPRPGWLTSEAWVSIVTILTALLAGVGAIGLPEDHPMMRAACFIAAALAAVGYTVGRSLTKR